VSGFWQVTLGGKPLYHYSGDSKRRGAANGDAIPDPPGTWHVITASSFSRKGSTTTTHTSTSTSSTYSYPYP
jgi:hypothetical protein